MKFVGTRLVILLVAAQPFKVVVALAAELTANEVKFSGVLTPLICYTKIRQVIGKNK